MRALRLVAVTSILSCAAVLGCAHKPPPPPPAPLPPPPPPKGDTLRFKAKPGDAVRNKVSVLIEQQVSPGDKKAKPINVVLKFSFGDEETVDAVSPDGSQLVSARLVDAVGEAQAGGNQKIIVLVPMSEMLTYANQLHSLTSGRGLYSMEFSHYEEVPSHIAQKIIAERQAQKDEKHN